MRNSKTVSPRKVGRTRLASAISYVLNEEGIPPERKGYHYLACAIELAYRDREMAGLVCKGLYPAVAKVFSSSPAAVERSIRTAIACGRAAREKEGVKTNASFIFRAVEKVKIRLDKR
ncbi:MAG: sporulation initiation factor Spo0A C-terminal domain-containing protein [Firmicutes bacterium]|nr:sporulation initiation factor Spo0A C-terminal domain-containing protein [Bacillota bacterium]